MELTEADIDALEEELGEHLMDLTIEVKPWDVLWDQIKSKMKREK